MPHSDVRTFCARHRYRPLILRVAVLVLVQISPVHEGRPATAGLVTDREKMTTGVSAETRACRRPGGGGPGLLRNLYGSAFTAGLHAAVLVAGIVSLLAAAVPLSIRR